MINIHIFKRITYEFNWSIYDPRPNNNETPTTIGAGIGAANPYGLPHCQIYEAFFSHTLLKSHAAYEVYKSALKNAYIWWWKEHDF